MKQRSIDFLRFVICLIALIVLAYFIRFPLTEGRAANLDLISIYKDPLIIYIYIGTIPFFIALHEAYKLLGLIKQNKIFSTESVKSVRSIKYLALACIAFLIGAILYIRLFVHGDDPAGPTMLGFITIFALTVIATAAGVFQKLLQNAIDLKSENDLTV